jgi:hypothetical protein
VPRSMIAAISSIQTNLLNTLSSAPPGESPQANLDSDMAQTTRFSEDLACIPAFCGTCVVKGPLAPKRRVSLQPFVRRLALVRHDCRGRELDPGSD